MSNALMAASAAADYGWQVFPAHPTVKKSYKSKERYGRNWGMTSDAAEIEAHFTRWPDARIGIPSGAVNGFIVIETDTKSPRYEGGDAPSLRGVIRPRRARGGTSGASFSRFFPCSSQAIFLGRSIGSEMQEVPYFVGRSGEI